jgi:hypothetical protein
VTDPALSVVVPSVSGWDDLRDCLAALAAQSVPVEVLVADRLGPAVREAVRGAFPEVRLLEAPRGATIPQLRAAGIAEARASVVGVIEDHVLVPPGWAAAMLAAHEAGAEVVGGAVRNAATRRLRDRAAFICEYSHCLAPPPGPAEWLPGNNVTYRRARLEEAREVLAEGRWEDRLHAALRARGVTLVMRPDIVVVHRKRYRPGEYPRQRYLYSRAFAGLRVVGASSGRRLLMGMLAFALPPVLLWRTARRVWQTGAHRRDLVLGLPLIAGYVLAWAAGEIVGYWRGAGGALAEVT